MDTTHPIPNVEDDHGLKLLQPDEGYRFSADALLLADFAIIPSGGRVIDLGCGCGVISLLLAQRAKLKEVIGLELQPELADIAWENVHLNKLEHKLKIIQADLRRVKSLFKQYEFDALVSNPPYWRVEMGRLNPNPHIAIARHELHINIDELLQACAYLVRPRGKVNLIYPVQRLAELWEGLRRYQLQPKQLQFVHPNPQTEAGLFMLMASPQGRPGLKVLPPKWLVVNSSG